MSRATYTKSLVIGGLSFARTSQISADGSNAFSVALTLAKALTSWVKTDADTAAGNLATGHGLTTGTYDVYWAGGSRKDVSVTISTDACALDGGTGTDFPASATTTVVLAPLTSLNGFNLDGDNCSIVACDITCPTPEGDPDDEAAGRISFRDASANVIEEVSLETNGDPNINDIYAGEANRYTGAVITNAKASTGETDTSKTVYANVAYMFDASV